MAPVNTAGYLAQTGIAEEEEGLVLLDGAADVTAKLVAVVRRNDSGLRRYVPGPGLALKSVLRLNSNKPP
jgi:hypothetical protein